MTSATNTVTFDVPISSAPMIFEAAMKGDMAALMPPG
jgi:hypothetical protein